MDLDEMLPKTPGDPLTELVKQDLDPLSVDELEARVAVLKAEIERCEAKKNTATAHRAAADELFKKR